MIYIGDDPGKTGAIVALDDDGGVIDVLRKKNSSYHDWCQFVTGLDVDNSNDFYAVVEKVSASRQMGVTSAFSFGGSFTASLMMYAALGIRHESYPPQTWQKALALTKVKKSDGDTAKKRYLKENAQRLFPDQNIINDTADAYLIAWFARRCFMGAN